MTKFVTKYDVIPNIFKKFQDPQDPQQINSKDPSLARDQKSMNFDAF